MLKCPACGRKFKITHDNIVSIDSARMEALVRCPHCKKTNTVKCAQAEIMTPQGAMEAAVKAIRAYKGEAIERAVYGAIGAATALERVGLLSTEDGANWCAAAWKAGEEQQVKMGRKTSGKKTR